MPLLTSHSVETSSDEILDDYRPTYTLVIPDLTRKFWSIKMEVSLAWYQPELPLLNFSLPLLYTCLHLASGLVGFLLRNFNAELTCCSDSNWNLVWPRP